MADRRQSKAAARHSIPPARTASLTSQRSIGSRNSVDVFGDEFSLERLYSSSTSRSISPIDEYDSQLAPTNSQSQLIYPANQQQAVEPPAGSRNSVSKRVLAQRYAAAARQLNRDQTTSASASIVRTPSTASQLTLPPRAPSPYTGATGPSHPYGMYPQVTRNSSTSTVRQPDAAYAGPSAPEHAYAMYGQNTVPEETEPVVPHSVIPLGFPGMRGGYQTRVDQQGEDVGDIVGPDGHTEQLPPYSRFPDDTSGKRTVALAAVPVAPASSAPEEPPHEPTRPPTAPADDRPVSQGSVATSEPQDNNSGDHSTCSGDSGSGSSFSEKLRRNGKRRICFGLPLWLVLGVLGVIVFAATLGAIIGGVVANQRDRDDPRQADPNAAETPTTVPATTVTATSYIDGTPLPSGTILLDIPVGQYKVPTYQIKSNVATCVVDPGLTPAWGCLPPSGLDMMISSEDDSDASRKRGPPRKKHTVSFRNYSLTPNFTYWAQLPDFKGQQFELTPFMDKDQSNLGPALFFYTSYDKLNILPEELIKPNNLQARSVDQALVERGSSDSDSDGVRKASPGDRPWFCHWNETLFEMFVYVNKTIASVQPSSQPSTTPSVTRTSTTPIWSATTELPAISVTGTPIYPSTFRPTPTGFTDPSKSDRITPRGDKMGQDGPPTYPQYVKVVEKRKPGSTIQPYCRQMLINSDGSWQPLPDVPTVTVTETEPAGTATPTSGANSRVRRLARDMQLRTESLESRQISGASDSLCACLWLST